MGRSFTCFCCVSGLITLSLLGACRTTTGQELPIVYTVETQPLKSQAKRIAQALEFLGQPLSAEEQARGVHSHSEDEIIFVTDGQIRLGTKLYGPGTALAIAADTLYSFTAGPEGLSFINFRSGTPGDIQFANGSSISETGYWRERLPRPEYVEQ